MNGPTFENTQFKNHCGYMVERTAKFCPECGLPVESLEERLKKLEKENQQLKQKIAELERSQENLQETKGKTLKDAALVNDTILAQQLLERGHDVNKKFNNETALHIATEKGNNQIVEFLINNGADVNITEGYNNEKALHVSARQGNNHIVKEILRHSDNIDAVNSKGDTPLLIACFFENLNTVKFLLGEGADPDFMDKDGYTPLHWAADHNRIELAKILILNGVDKTIHTSIYKDLDDEIEKGTPYDFAYTDEMRSLLK